MGKPGKRRLVPLEVLWAQHHRRVEKAIATRFHASLMSNAKWRKVFRILCDPGLGLSRYRWKFVDDGRIFDTEVVREMDLDERGLRDGRFQPFVFREIEWIEILTDNTDEVSARLDRGGHFRVERIPSGILIRGYE